MIISFASSILVFNSFSWSASFCLASSFSLIFNCKLEVNLCRGVQETFNCTTGSTEVETFETEGKSSFPLLAMFVRVADVVLVSTFADAVHYFFFARDFGVNKSSTIMLNL